MNIQLRKIDKSDSESIISWRNNPNVLKNFVDQRILTLENHNKWLQDYVETGLVCQYIIEVIEGEDVEKVGSVFLKGINHINLTAEFGIFIGNDSFRGKGIGTTAVNLAVRKAFNEFGLDSVFLRVFKDNINAIQSYKKIGFREDLSYKSININERTVIFMSLKRGDLI